MDDDHKSSTLKCWFNHIKHQLLFEPGSLDELKAVLHQAIQKNILDHETLNMIEGVLAISKMQVRDIMIPRAQMLVLELNQPYEVMLNVVVESSHSRFPVISETKDDVIGILLVKDFLKAHLQQGEIDIHSIIRPAFFVPESKRIDSLLNEFKSRHNHLAIVVDEYGGIAGLVTIEDILEEIVGDIEDEFDEISETAMTVLGENHYQFSAFIKLEDLNEKIETAFQDEEIDTIGGLLTRTLSHIPKVGESVVIQGWKMSATKVDSRRVLQVELFRLPT